MVENGKMSLGKCVHHRRFTKPVESMNICVNGMEYAMGLVKSGELDAIQCEMCTIQWLCGVPIDTCMNMDDTPQWHTQCTRTVPFWMNQIEMALNHHKWFKQHDYQPYDIALVKSMVEYMEKHNLVVNVVEKVKK